MNTVKMELNCQISMEIIQDMNEIGRRFPKYVHVEDYYDEPFIFVENGEVLAKGDMRIEGNTAVIEMIMACEMRKGYGRMFIEHLKSRQDIHRIKGQSIPLAVPFWYQMNAQFNETEFNEFIEDEYDEDILLGFSIECS